MKKIDVEAILSSDVNYDFIPEIMKIDSLVYSKELQGTYETISDRFKANNESYILMVDKKDNSIIGYICFFPITFALYEKIISTSDIVDNDISANDIVKYSLDQPNYLYIISVAILSKYRDSGVIEKLINAYNKFLKQKVQIGYAIECILGTAISNDGIKFLKKLNFSFYKDLQFEYKLFMCNNMQLNNMLINGYIQSTPSNNLYIMLPFYTEGDIEDYSFQIENYNQIAATYMEQLKITSNYECSTKIDEHLEYRYLGVVQFGYMNDNYNEIIGNEEVYLFLTCHKNTKLYILTILFNETIFSITQIEDQMSNDNLKIKMENEYININDYMFKKYNLQRCGDGKCVICLSSLPKDVKELHCMLAAEAYNSSHISYSVDSRQIEQICMNDIAQYDFYEAYASTSCIVFVEKNKLSDFRKKFEIETLVTFISELSMFQIAAISRTNQRIITLLSSNERVSLKTIENMYGEFGRSIEFWQKSNCKYPLAQNFANEVNKAFKISELLEDYYRNQSHLEHIVELRGIQTAELESKIINIVAILLGTIQVIPLVYECIQFMANQQEINKQLIIGISIFLLVLILIKNTRKMKSKSISNRAK